MKTTLTALLLFLFTLPALAEPDVPTASAAPAARVHDYNLLDVVYLYQDIDIDNRREQAHGFGVAGGVHVNDWFSLWASSSAVVLETETVDVTTAVIGIGVAAHAPVTDKLSAYASVGHLTAEVEAEWADGRDARVSVSTDGNGYTLGAGLRAWVLPRLELSLGVSLVSIEDESDTSLGGGFQYSLTDKVALGAVVSVADDVIGAAFGARFYFK